MKRFFPLLTAALLFVSSCETKVETETTNASDEPDTVVVVHEHDPSRRVGSPSGSDGSPVTEDEIAADGDEATIIQDIRDGYSKIMSAVDGGQAKSTVKEYDCHGETSGKVTYYALGGELRMIEHNYNAYSHFGATERYYLRDGKLFFAFLDETSWVFDSESGQGETKDDITEKRFYLHEGEPVRCLEKKFTIRSAKKDNPESANVPNKKVDCSSMKEVVESFEALKAYKESRQGCPNG